MAKDHPTGESGLYSALLELKTPEECYRFLQDVCSYAELSAMEQRYNIAEKLVSKQSYTSIMGNIGASSAIISRVSRVISREDSVLRRLLEEKAEAPAADPNAPKGKEGAAADFNDAMNKAKQPEVGAPVAKTDAENRRSRVRAAAQAAGVVKLVK